MIYFAWLVDSQKLVFSTYLGYTPCSERLTKKEMLHRMDKQRELVKTIKKTQARYLGHIVRGQKYSLLRFILQGKIIGSRISEEGFRN